MTATSEVPAGSAAPAAHAPRRPAPQPARRSYTPTIADYSYVAGDLRRIGILAGSLVGLLVILSFIIR